MGPSIHCPAGLRGCGSGSSIDATFVPPRSCAAMILDDRSRVACVLGTLILAAIPAAAGAVDVTQVTHASGDLVSATDPAWAPDSQHLILTRTTYGPGDLIESLTSVDLSGNRDAWPTIDGIVCREPAWSPDGSKLVFVYDADGLSGTTLAMLANGASMPSLLSFQDPSMQPCWSGDGTKIAIGYGSNIWILPPDGSASQQVTHGNGGEMVPTWSPSGDRIAFCAGGGNVDVWIVTVATGDVVQLTDNPAVDCEPTWSPDGHWIAFCSNRGGDFDIWAQGAPGTTAVRITSGPGDDVQPCWSPDGTRIAFTSTRDGSHQVWVTQPLPDLTTAATTLSWSEAKAQYRDRH